jgi:hypothetical protein
MVVSACTPAWIVAGLTRSASVRASAVRASAVRAFAVTLEAEGARLTAQRPRRSDTAVTLRSPHRRTLDAH